jgi:lipid A 4'-phosphatase
LRLGLGALMSYLKLTRARIILACFLISSLLLVQYPGIDISIARVFFHKGFFADMPWWVSLCRGLVTGFLFLTMACLLAIYAFNRISKQKLGGVDGKKVLYLILVLVVGAGLIVNVMFKDNFGRARPRHMVEFGGSKLFTPAFVVSRECENNCSFSSGEGAGAFFSLALALALSRKRSTLLVAFGFGSLVSLSRIAAGAHFFSDTVVSFFVMLIVADVLYYYLLVPKPARVPDAVALVRV